MVKITEKDLKALSIIDKLEERGKYCPDFGTLRKYEYHLLFVYDSLKVYQDLNYYLKSFENVKYLGEGRTHTNSYIVKKYGDDDVIAFDDFDPFSNIKAKIIGDVFAVPPEVLLELDILKEHTILTNRKKRSVLLKDQFVGLRSIQNPFVQAHIYLGIKDIWSLEKGVPVYRFSAWDKSKNKTSSFWEYK